MILLKQKHDIIEQKYDIIEGNTILLSENTILLKQKQQKERKVKMTYTDIDRHIYG